MAEKKFEDTVFSEIIRVCCKISDSLEKEEFEVLDALFVQRKNLNNLAPAMPKDQIEKILELDREIIVCLERKRALTATNISEVRRAKKALQTLNMTRSRPPGRRRMAVTA